MRTKKQISIKGEYIKLDQLLKLAGVADSGGHAKSMVLNGDVKVNGQTVVQRGKKIKMGDRVICNDVEIKIGD